MQQSRVKYLSEKYLAQTATREELEEFYELVKDAQADNEIKEALFQDWIHYNTTQQLSESQADFMFNSLLQEAKRLYKQPARAMFIKYWKRVAVAAVVLILFGTSRWFFFNRTPKQKVTQIKQTVIHDVTAPLKNQAVITLASGKKIYIDSANKGTLVSQGNIQLVKLANGEIAYTPKKAETALELIYNTLTNPRGSKVATMTLADGTKVWLNAESSITYPVAFIGKERKIEITGEAYFEVAKDPSKPFFVKKINDDAEIEVLGTHFNVNGYDDENSIKITLLEGSLKIAMANKTLIIEPGEQAELNKRGLITLNKNIDLDDVMAWKTGWFSFSGVQIPDIMKHLSRWYDVEVAYEGKISEKHFSGIVSRNSNISEILKIMQKAGIKFKIEGKTITVLQ